MALRLYTSRNSPFGARIAIAERAKGIEIPVAALPAGGLRSNEFLALNPIAKIPVLVTETDVVLPESSVILHYLERRYPEPSLYPPDLDGWTMIDLAVTIVDRYICDPIIRLFPNLDPARRKRDEVDRELARWRAGLAALVHHVRFPLPQAPASVNMADCALPPALHLGTRIAAMLGLEKDPMTEHQILQDYYDQAKTDPIIGAVLKDLTEYQAKTDVAAGRPSLAHLH